MMSPTKLSLPCVIDDKKNNKFELNDSIEIEVSVLGTEIHIRDQKITVHLPNVDALNVVETLKILLESTYDDEEEEFDDDDYEFDKDETEQLNKSGKPKS